MHSRALAKAMKICLLGRRKEVWAIRIPLSPQWVLSRMSPADSAHTGSLEFHIGVRDRAPLGAKTTNAKAKAFQTTVLPTANDKPNQRSASARKAKPRVSHAEMTKLEVLGDKDELEEREIEYMPPRGKGDEVRAKKSGQH